MIRNILIALLAASLLSAVPAKAETFDLPPEGYDVVGSVSTIVAQFDDTLIDIAQRYGFGYEDLVRANPGVDVWVPGEGTEIVLPGRFILPAGPRTGVVLNIAEYRLYYYPKPEAGKPAQVMTFPISIGRQDWETPIGLTKVVQKVVNPAWYPPQSVRDEHEADGRPLPRVVPAGPDNPLGSRAMRLGLPGYLIHGTNRPAGVGMRVTHGCLRMFPKDIEFLFEYVPVNTPVRIVNEPVKIGWEGDELVLEAHPVLATAPAVTSDVPLRDTEISPEEAIEAGVAESVDAPVTIAPPSKSPLTYATEQFIVATGERAGELDWSRVEAALERADGLPVAVGVGVGIKNAATSAAFE